MNLLEVYLDNKKNRIKMIGFDLGMDAFSPNIKDTITSKY